MYNQLKSVSLFSGIGGLSFGKTQLYCEIDKQCRKVLLARMDDGSLDSAEIHSDILTLDSVPIGTELIYGGFPCVALSAAGKQAGIHGKETDMFFEMVRLIQQSKCSYCFFENVAILPDLPPVGTRYCKQCMKWVTIANGHVYQRKAWVRGKNESDGSCYVNVCDHHQKIPLPCQMVLCIATEALKMDTILKPIKFKADF